MTHVIIEKVARAKAARLMAETTEENGVPRWQARGFESLDAAVEANWKARVLQATADTLAVLDAIAEPSETQMAAANALPVTKIVDGMIATTAIRYGGIGPLPGAPDTPLQQWYRAMITTLHEEVRGK